MARKKADGVEILLRKADRTLDEWFKQSRMTTQQASQAFARFLGRARREGAGTLRLQVDGLQAGLRKLSEGLQQMERPARATTKKRSRTVSARRRTSARKQKKAA